ncbi:MAG TPA: 50S ribosomal protein L23 [Armatimonadota bacterium]|jgi:large subunit ribosomal protein L23
MLSSDQANHFRTIIVAPVISEKAMADAEEAHKYHFRVKKYANKVEIQQAVEALFNVRVLSVNTLNVRGKLRRRSVKHRMGKTADWKKAIVKLAPGDRIDVIAGQ